MMCGSHASSTNANSSPPLAAAATGPALHALTLTDGDGGLSVGSCSTHTFLDLTGHGKESLLDIGGALGRGLEERNAEAVCELLWTMLLCTLTKSCDPRPDVPLLLCTQRPSYQPYRTCCRRGVCSPPQWHSGQFPAATASHC